LPLRYIHCVHSHIYYVRTYRGARYCPQAAPPDRPPPRGPRRAGAALPRLLVVAATVGVGFGLPSAIALHQVNSVRAGR
jgi:hypothetical protein